MALEEVQHRYLDRALRDGTVHEEVEGMVAAAEKIGELRGQAQASSLASAKIRVLIGRFAQHYKDIMPEDRDPFTVDFEGEAAEMEADTWITAAMELAQAFGLPGNTYEEYL